MTLNDGMRTTPSFTATGLANGTRYYFRVFARSAAGLSPASNVANAIPRPYPAFGPTYESRGIRGFPGLSDAVDHPNGNGAHR